MNIIKENINDILDSKGLNNNFLNDKPYTNEYIELGSRWSQLPMYKDVESTEKFFNLLHNNQVILLISGTGSGKTVLVPKYVLKYNKTLKIPGKIAITNPKTLTTVYNAEYAARTLDVKLGEEVGYKFRGSGSEFISDKSELLYVTDGLLLAKILGGDKTLKEFNTVIIDEAHERGIQIDLLLKFMKEILPIRPEFKVIIMSATINPEVFRDYYKSSELKYDQNSKGIHDPKLDRDSKHLYLKYGEIEVFGSSNRPIRQIYLENKNEKLVNRSSYVEYAVKTCIKILDTTEFGDILVFVATSNDANKGCLLLEEQCPKQLVLKKNLDKFCSTVYCVEVYSKMKQENKELAVSKDLYKTKYPNKDRKIIFATNIAESSITFDGLVYVIDSGFELTKFFEPMKNATVVNKVYTTQAQIKQRVGRVGRTQPGIAYHLYTQLKFSQLEKFPKADVLTIDLTEYMLSFIKYSKTINTTIDILENLITEPTINQFKSSLHKLHFINALKIVDKNDKKLDKINWSSIKNYNDFKTNMNGALTTLGYVLLRFRSTSLFGALAVIMSYYFGSDIQMEIIKLVSIIDSCEGNLDNLFVYKNKDKPQFIKELSKYSVTNSDHLTILNVFNKYYLEEEQTQY